MMTRKLFASILSLILFAHALAPLVAAAQDKRSISLLLVNGKIFTADERGSIAEAVAIDGERIVAVGDTKDLQSRFQAARTVDLRGRLVTPGFNDAHIHFLNGGLSLLRVDLNGAATLAEAKRRVAARVAKARPGEWIQGRGWDHTLWGGEWPAKKDLDEVAPENPVYLTRVDGHVSWANSLALQKANVTRETRAPEGGEILHDAKGEPTGILKETAQGLVARLIPQPTREQLLEALEFALAEARRYGITSIQTNDVPSAEATPLYRELLGRDRLTVRVSMWQQFDNSVEDLKRERAEFESHKVNPLRIRLGALKGVLDGTLGSRTAAMNAPYSDDPKNSGLPRRPAEEMVRMIVERDRAGFQLALHAIGDRANRIALDGFAAAAHLDKKGASGVGAQRHRIEHAQVVAPSDFERFRNLGVIASMQPAHAISDKRWAQERLGEYRVLGAYSWRMMKSFGVPVAFGTDWPVEPINPYLGLYAAVTRQSAEGEPEGGWWPQERLTIEDAIRHYTAGAAYATFEEKEKGRIAEGMLADLVIHARDLLAVKPEEILKTEAAMTIFNGRIVHETPEPK